MVLEAVQLSQTELHQPILTMLPAAQGTLSAVRSLAIVTQRTHGKLDTSGTAMVRAMARLWKVE